MLESLTYSRQNRKNGCEPCVTIMIGDRRSSIRAAQVTRQASNGGEKRGHR